MSPNSEGGESGGADAAPVADGPGPAPDAPSVLVNHQYIKDLSFEAPQAPDIFKQIETNPPNVDIHIDVGAEPREPNVFEIVLKLKVECITDDVVAFILELDYAGLFTIHVPPEDLQRIVLVECPRLLFPFARSIIYNTAQDGGFPAIMVAPVDFDGMYREQMEQLAQQQAQAPGSPPGPSN